MVGTFDFKDLSGFGLYPVSMQEGGLVQEGRGVQLRSIRMLIQSSGIN